MRYFCRGSSPGIESSMCVYRNYGYVADNHGNLADSTRSIAPTCVITNATLREAYRDLNYPIKRRR